MDANQWFHLVGLISALLLGLGFITGLISVGLSWVVNKQQESKNNELRLAIEAEGVKTAEANAKAAMATEGIAKANEEIARLNNEAMRAKTVQQTVETELAKQRERAARAELELADLRKRQLPRHIPFEVFQSALKNMPTGKTTIVYQPEDTEAWAFAADIHMALQKTGWDAGPLPSPVVRDEKASLKLPSVMSIGGFSSGVTIHAKTTKPPSPNIRTAFNALYMAFMKSGFGVGAMPNQDLEENAFIIVVGPKPTY